MKYTTYKSLDKSNTKMHTISAQYLEYNFPYIVNNGYTN